MEAPHVLLRTLMWEVMEKIWYLHKEFAESWSFPRLAEGFDVSPSYLKGFEK
jgi:hypothetical protein